MIMQTTTFKTLVESGRKPYALAREIVFLDDALPMLVGMVVYQNTFHIAAIAIEVVRRITNSSARRFAVTVFDRCIYLEEVNKANTDRIAMVINRRSDAGELADAIAFTAEYLNGRADND